jgi:hypothetical protein
MEFTVIDVIGEDMDRFDYSGLTAWEMLSLLNDHTERIYMHRDGQTTNITDKVWAWFDSNEEFDEFLEKL